MIMKKDFITDLWYSGKKKKAHLYLYTFLNKNILYSLI